MKRIIVLGGSGMLGHKAFQVLSEDFDTFAAFQTFSDALRRTGIYDERKILDGIDIVDFAAVKRGIETINPAVILNCIGVIKQRAKARNPRVAIYSNALFPHLLAEHCADREIRLIHISTDCVFSGRVGGYIETDTPDADDLYGRTKHLGEVDDGNALTLRTSIVGHELFSHFSLIDWFLSQEGKMVRGYTNAIYTGFPTVVLCRELARVISEYPHVKGLYHFSSDPITKYELLCHVRDVYGVNVDIVPDDEVRCNRSLNSDKYRRELKFSPVGWREMIEMMHADRRHPSAGMEKHDLR